MAAVIRGPGQKISIVAFAVSGNEDLLPELFFLLKQRLVPLAAYP